jgi:hypothetical protein
LFAVCFQQTNALDLKHPETQRLFLETRFEQLKLASDLELWQEAYALLPLFAFVVWLTLTRLFAATAPLRTSTTT